ncbi:MAG: hypothetical protein ACE5IE_02010 [Dehalococcoidia bacterium]
MKGVVVENKTLSLTDEIYAELVDGLKRGLDWTHFLAKHSASKGPLYNAIGRFFNDMEPKLRALNEVQTELDQAGLKLDSLDQRIKEAETSLAPLEERKSTLNEQIETLETKLAEKSELLEHVGELEKLAFDIEMLRQLKDALREIGAKHGLKGKQAITKFFSDLQDYDARIGFEREILRLETITGTKKLEAEKWQAEADSLARRHKDLSEAITAVQRLTKHGVKTEQIVSWNGIVSKLGGPEELQDKLGQYKSMSELIEAKEREIEDCDKKAAELSAQIKALNEQKAEIEGAIKSLSGSGVKEITKVSDKAITELKSLLAEIRVETKRLADLKAEAGKLEKELMYARYLTATDETVLKAFPKEVVIAFLERAATWCRLNNLNPMVRISAPSERTLIDLMAWAEAILAGVSQ